MHRQYNPYHQGRSWNLPSNVTDYSIRIITISRITVLIMVEASLERSQIADEDELHLAVQGYQRATINA